MVVFHFLGCDNFDLLHRNNLTSHWKLNRNTIFMTVCKKVSPLKHGVILGIYLRFQLGYHLRIPFFLTFSERQTPLAQLGGSSQLVIGLITSLSESLKDRVVLFPFQTAPNLWLHFMGETTPIHHRTVTRPVLGSHPPSVPTLETLTHSSHLQLQLASCAPRFSPHFRHRWWLGQLAVAFWWLQGFTLHHISGKLQQKTFARDFFWRI